MGFNLGKIKIGQSASSYKHDVGCDIHSTLNFKFVQPTYMLPMDGGNRINLRLRQLVRLAPLPAADLKSYLDTDYKYLTAEPADS